MLTASEYAIKHGISKQWACDMARAGRIEGAVRHGRMWLIPDGAGMPEPLPSGRVPSMDSSRLRRMAEAARKRAEVEAAGRALVVVPRREVEPVRDEYKRERDRWWNDMLGMDIEPVGGRWAGIDGSVVGVGWAVGESAKQFEARYEEWRVWKEAGQPDEGMPADYREWLGDSNNQLK